MLSRRSMLTLSTAVVTGVVGYKPGFGMQAKKRKFTLDLRAGSVGIKADQREANRLAVKYGFESVNADPRFLARLSKGEMQDLKEQMQEDGLVWGSAGLPVEFRKDKSKFEEDLSNLPALAEALQNAGVTRVGTWLMPNSDELTYSQNFKQHALRLRECAKVLEDHGQRLGLEYVGPRTLWTAKRYPFLHTMAETKELIGEIGKGKVGFILDCWHWYTAEETVDDLMTLNNDQIVACDLNDAPKGRSVAQQIDNQRELPMATGVIDLKGFLAALVELGYDGPIRAEPFNAKLNQMDNEEAASATATAMKAAFALVQ